MKRIDLSIIIVNFNTPGLVYDCLRSIKEKVGLNYEVVVVENGSKKDLQIKRSELDQIGLGEKLKVVFSEKNLGFGGGNNLGAKQAEGDYLFLLNSDTIILDDSIDKMVQFSRQHLEIGALTCLLFQKDGKTLQKNYFGKFQSLGSVTIRRYNYAKIDLGKEFFYTDIVTGAALMVRRELYQKIGGFDENIFMYLEDDDLCKRLVNLGYKNALLTTAKIIHLEGKSSNNKNKKNFYYASQNYYWRKHNGLIPTLVMRLLRWPMKILKTRK